MDTKELKRMSNYTFREGAARPRPNGLLTASGLAVQRFITGRRARAALIYDVRALERRHRHPRIEPLFAFALTYA
ncbi:hypothetical protein [Paraburkholderia caledonica]|uniref:hypothetical protein n=1 Tax=Paraburkholderia caledonica TaxID=134536 RepID=UPI00037054C4|nr:hypothetical protein [Paraburkholderia caledonica]